jgi:phage terminase large subunit GpA-like protein
MEEEVVIPDGPFKGAAFSCARQPYTGLLFDEYDRDYWSEIIVGGPSQSGKTLSSFVGPVLYQIFELRETTVVGLPDINMARDKWEEDFRPVIDMSRRFKEMLPKKGEGSRGGRMSRVRFENGATLRFMSGGGSEKARAGFTTRRVNITESDGLGARAGVGKEANKIKQLVARTRAYGARRRVMAECTFTDTDGFTWRGIKGGTDSRLMSRCVACGDWVYPTQEHLVGWKEAESEEEAMEEARFVCPSCGAMIDDDMRAEMNRGLVLVHRGQRVEGDGVVTGDGPRTRTLGFRWELFHNMLMRIGDAARDEWKSLREDDPTDAAREIRQFLWGLPVEPQVFEETPVDWREVEKRMRPGTRRGRQPEGVVTRTVGADIRKTQLHYAVLDWFEDGSCVVSDYDFLAVRGERDGAEVAVRAALKEFFGVVGKMDPAPEWTLVDAGYCGRTVIDVCHGSDLRGLLPVLGRGESLFREGKRFRPAPKEAIFVGDGLWVGPDKDGRGHVMFVDVDHWKRWVSEGLTVGLDRPGAMVFYESTPGAHNGIALQLTAEVELAEMVDGQGTRRVWKKVRQANHWLDCVVYASAGGFAAGVRRVDLSVEEAPAALSAGDDAAEKKTRAAGGIRGRDGGGWFRKRKR